MPVTTRFEPDTGIAHYVATGELTLAEVLAALGEVYSDPAYKSPSRSLWEMKDAHPKLDGDDVLSVVNFVRTHRPSGEGRAAIVAERDLAFGLSRMYELLADDQRVATRVFREVERARQWLLEDEPEPGASP